MKDRNQRSGQAMLIAVLALGGAMLGATAIAGLLILYQLRATTNSVNSSKAIFAADSGTDFALFSYYCVNEKNGNGKPRCTKQKPPKMSAFSDGATTTVTCYDVNNAPTTCFNNVNAQYAIAIGSSSGSRRAFYLNIIGATTSYP
jgi:hypothetical protein